jgi:hypothetical protein
MGESQKCVVDELFGFQHPYMFCVKPSDKMVDSSTFNRGGWSLDNTAKVFGGMFNYVDYLLSDAHVGTAEQCLYNGRGVIGNNYVLRTNIECTPVDSLGNTITPAPGETPYLHKYINNITDGSSFLTGGQSNADLTGVIPSAFYSATKIGSNIMDLVSSFNGRVKPYCMKASVKCHLVDYSEGVRGTRNYSGNSPQVYFAIDDLKRLKPESFSDGAAITIPTMKEPDPSKDPNTDPSRDPNPDPSRDPNPDPSKESFYNNGPTINDIIIKQNMDKIQNLSDIDKMLDSINIDKALNFEDELLVKMFYVGFSIFMILIILKLVFKKK